MGPKTSSGFYLSRTSAALLALLLVALLLALTVLGALYARSGAPGKQGEQLGSSSSSSSNSSSSTVSTPPTSLPLPSLPPGTTGRPGIWDNLRLPGSLVPLHYDLELWPRMVPDEEDNYRLTGQVNITLLCAEGTGTVLLHSHRLNFSRAELRLLREGEGGYPRVAGGSRQWQAGVSPHVQEVRSRAQAGEANSPLPGERGMSMGIKSLWLSEVHQYLVLELDRELVGGNLYLLELDYQGFLSDGYMGLFVTHYQDFNVDRVLIASALEPTSARSVYPCFDEPAMKATFKTRIVHNSSYVALSNMPAIAVSEREDVNGTKWTVTTFNTTLKMSTYITAFVVCDFDYVKTTERGNEIRIWARKEVVQNGSADFALSIAGPLLSFMEDLLNVTYPLQKTDFVAIPDSGVGAMENWGLITFLEARLIYNPSQKFSNAKALICLIVSHEIGHQWFGNLVTMKWWNDLWLNEGFASFMEYIGASFIDSKLKLNELFLLHDLQHIFETDGGTTPRSMSVKEEDIHEASDIMPLFDVFTYSKGAAFVRMVSSFMTERLFYKGISSYLKTFSFSNADQDDLWNHLQMVIDDQDEVQLPTSLKQIMDSWTWQEGIPLLTLNTSTGEMTEEQFKIDRRDNNTVYNNHTWIVPVSWIKNGLEQPTIWQVNRTEMFTEMRTASDDEWILININVTGYYRANYDVNNWNRLAEQLQKDPKALPVVNRVQLLDDAFTLTKAGYIEYETALNLTKYLEKEEEIVVWYTVLKNMMSFKNSLVTYSSFPLIKKYILKRINPIYQRYASLILRNVDELADDYFIHMGIEVIIKTACSLGLQDCLELASDLYSKWMNSPSNNEIPYCIRKPIYCYAIAMGGEREWEFAWKMSNRSNIEGEMELDFLIHGMSCTKDPWLIYRFLQHTFERSTHFAVDVFLNVLRNDIGRPIAWEFMRDNRQRIDARFPEPSDFYDTLLPTLGWKATSDEQFQEIKLFINSTMSTMQRDNALQKAEKERKISLEWRQKVNTKVIDWLQKNTEHSDF